MSKDEGIVDDADPPRRGTSPIVTDTAESAVSNKGNGGPVVEEVSPPSPTVSAYSRAGQTVIPSEKSSNQQPQQGKAPSIREQEAAPSLFHMFSLVEGRHAMA